MRTIAAAAIAASALAVRIQLTLRDEGVEVEGLSMDSLDNVTPVEIEMPADETALTNAATDRYNKALAYVDKVIEEGKPWTDPVFKPDIRSLFKPDAVIGPDDKWQLEHLQWKRLSELYPGGKLFNGDPFPKEVIQGNLGNCYLIAAMASIAAEADDVRGLFKYDDVNPAGIYAVELYVNGVKEIVVVDDFVPVYQEVSGEIVVEYAHASDESYWVYLVEKAWSKLHGDYWSTAGGNPGFAATHLFGTAAWKEDHNSTFDKVENRDALWERMHRLDRNGWSVMAATINPNPNGGEVPDNKTGLVLNHAYSVL